MIALFSLFGLGPDGTRDDASVPNDARTKIVIAGDMNTDDPHIIGSILNERVVCFLRTYMQRDSNSVRAPHTHIGTGTSGTDSSPLSLQVLLEGELPAAWCEED